MLEQATEGIDPTLGANALFSATLLRMVFMPLVSLRRRLPTDGDDATGPHVVPKPIQKAAAFAALAVCNVVAALVTGKPPIHAVSAGAVGALLAMSAYDLQLKREGSNAK